MYLSLSTLLELSSFFSQNPTGKYYKKKKKKVARGLFETGEFEVEGGVGNGRISFLSIFSPFFMYMLCLV